MSQSDKIITEALTWLNTPYHHLARVKGVGVDCAQLVAGIADNIKLQEERINIDTYSVEWHLHSREERMCQIIESFGCIRIDLSDREPGDILTFKFGRVNSHMGVMINNTQFIHARMDIEKVVINELSGDWIKRLDRVYKFPFGET
jgi:NlpC/P60 family putative phage cell wall peptidase